MFTDIMESTNMGLIQGRYRSGLASEPLSRRSVTSKVSSQDLDRHNSVETSVDGFVNLTHPAGTNKRDDLVSPKFRAGIKTY